MSEMRGQGPMFIVRGEHVKDCSALKYARSGFWPHPWCDYPEGHFRGDTQCRRNSGSQIWVEFRCNCTACNKIRLFVNASRVLVDTPYD